MTQSIEIEELKQKFNDIADRESGTEMLNLCTSIICSICQQGNVPKDQARDAFDEIWDKIEAAKQEQE